MIDRQRKVCGFHENHMISIKVALGPFKFYKSQHVFAHFISLDSFRSSNVSFFLSKYTLNIFFFMILNYRTVSDPIYKYTENAAIIQPNHQAHPS